MSLRDWCFHLSLKIIKMQSKKVWYNSGQLAKKRVTLAFSLASEKNYRT